MGPWINRCCFGNWSVVSVLNCNKWTKHLSWTPKFRTMIVTAISVASCLSFVLYAGTKLPRWPTTPDNKKPTMVWGNTEQNFQFIVSKDIFEAGEPNTHRIKELEYPVVSNCFFCSLNEKYSMNNCWRMVHFNPTWIE